MDAKMILPCESNQTIDGLAARVPKPPHATHRAAAVWARLQKRSLLLRLVGYVSTSYPLHPLAPSIGRRIDHIDCMRRLASQSPPSDADCPPLIDCMDALSIDHPIIPSPKPR